MVEAVRVWLLNWEPWSTAVILWVQSWSTPALDRLFHFAAFLGDEEFFFLVFPAMYWLWDKRLGRRLAYAMVLSLYTNSLVKHILMIPRPSDPRILVKRPVDPPNPGFPSGHAQNAITMWGFLACEARKKVIWLFAGVLVLLISLSRIYLGVHSPVDVIAGIVAGVIYLSLFLWLLPLAERWFQTISLSLKLILAVVLPLAGLFIHSADLQGLYPSPDAASITGALLGMSVGFILEPRVTGFQVKGAWWQLALRLLLGLTVVGLIWQGPKLLIPDDLTHSLDMALRFVRYAASGLAAILLAPWLFVKLKLARRQDASQPRLVR